MWARLGSCWAPLGPLWAPLGPSWVPLGPLWASLGPLWAPLGPWVHARAEPEGRPKVSGGRGLPHGGRRLPIGPQGQAPLYILYIHIYVYICRRTAVARPVCAEDIVILPTPSTTLTLTPCFGRGPGSARTTPRAHHMPKPAHNPCDEGANYGAFKYAQMH